MEVYLSDAFNGSLDEPDGVVIGQEHAVSFVCDECLEAFTSIDLAIEGGERRCHIFVLEFLVLSFSLVVVIGDDGPRDKWQFG